MSEQQTASPAEAIGQEASGETIKAAPTETTQQGHQEVAGATKTEGEVEGTKKPEKTPEQREIERLRRGIDRRTRQLAEERARNAGLNQQPQRANIPANEDSEPLTLTRAELEQRIKDEARRLAPTLQSEAAEVARRQGVIQSLAKNWGQERFDEISSDLDDAFGGLADASGKPKPAVEAVFEADNPAAVIEYLADPDNVDEAERIARMSPINAGRAIAKLEAKLEAAPRTKSPAPSKAPAPLEPVRAKGNTNTGAPDPSDLKAWIRWRNEQERSGR